MSILVCGGAGYIGSHTVYELLERGEDVIVLDNLSKGHQEAVPDGIKLCTGDLRDETFMDSVFSENNIEAVIDFAADSLVGESVEKPLKYFNNNVYGTLCLLETMEKYGVKNIVFSSTAATYGEPENIPIRETDKTFPTNPYGESKLTVEKMLKWSDNAYGMKYVVLRYFNAAGAHSSAKIGEDHSPETHLIPLILQVPLKKREKIYIFGNDYETRDGTCIRDYIHVTDLADAHILAVEKLRNGGESATYNLGNGTGFSVKEVIDTVEEVTGEKIAAEVTDRRSGDPATLIAISEKIEKELHWKPRFNKLGQIIESAWQWHKNNLDGF
ncbi:MAG: UDP-glucose 4-epimerase GalE [Verrucomicrobiota bacterium]|nr:UDP-glucose 4-epimerase GalE [Verrucomicrobiota bacterium]